MLAVEPILDPTFLVLGEGVVFIGVEDLLLVAANTIHTIQLESYIKRSAGVALGLHPKVIYSATRPSRERAARLIVLVTQNYIPKRPFKDEIVSLYVDFCFGRTLQSIQKQLEST